MTYIAFYKPTSYIGLKRLLWWIVSLFSPRYVHCDIIIGNDVIVADGFSGEVRVRSRYGRREPAVRFILPVDDAFVRKISEKYIGQAYGWMEIAKAGFPFISDKLDEPGVICSEHVAKTLIDVAKLTGQFGALRNALESMPLSGCTPRDVYDVVAQHLQKAP